jgi:RimJ/RimL family protein N-acetyltransferase
MSEEGSGARLAIDRVSDKSFIGWSSLTRWNPDNRSASMGYCLDDAAWGHGYATEAGRALLQWGRYSQRGFRSRPGKAWIRA